MSIPKTIDPDLEMASIIDQLGNKDLPFFFSMKHGTKFEVQYVQDNQWYLARLVYYQPIPDKDRSGWRMKSICLLMQFILKDGQLRWMNLW
jgi:hypothetical protein